MSVDALFHEQLDVHLVMDTVSHGELHFLEDVLLLNDRSKILPVFKGQEFQKVVMIHFKNKAPL